MNMLLAAKAPRVRHSFRARISSVTIDARYPSPRNLVAEEKVANVAPKPFRRGHFHQVASEGTFRQHNFDVAFQKECLRENSSV